MRPQEALQIVLVDLEDSMSHADFATVGKRGRNDDVIPVQGQNKISKGKQLSEDEQEEIVTRLKLLSSINGLEAKYCGPLPPLSLGFTVIVLFAAALDSFSQTQRGGLGSYHARWSLLFEIASDTVQHLTNKSFITPAEKQPDWYSVE